MSNLHEYNRAQYPLEATELGNAIFLRVHSNSAFLQMLQRRRGRVQTPVVERQLHEILLLHRAPRGGRRVLRVHCDSREAPAVSDAKNPSGTAPPVVAEHRRRRGLRWLREKWWTTLHDRIFDGPSEDHRESFLRRSAFVQRKLERRSECRRNYSPLKRSLNAEGVVPNK